MAYFTLNRDYIAEVLCVNKEKPITVCNGQCFLERNLNLPNETSTDDQLPTARQTIDFPVFLITVITNELSNESLSSEWDQYYRVNSSTEHLHAPFRPPSHRC